ncbi:MAG: SAM-dependent methyltransferase, partial [Clostridia bacterium]|nr:SAM-dependent methyltransferase [Clostridia bacterium]
MMTGNGRIVLDPRLSMIARLVGPCECYADIGCDHGRLGAFMLQKGLCQRAVLTDISEPSLAKARALMDHLDLADRVTFAVGDGARALREPVDAVVIAGMGGATIAQIVRDGRENLGGARLILQPNVAAPQLRQALSECGYAIFDEHVARDGRRNYVIICARPGR